MQAVVLAGGLATRMRPRTLTVPKSMLEVAGRPFVDWQLERLAECGFDEVVMCVAHLGEQIRAHVGDGSASGVKVAWAEEGPTLLGTAGALRAALPLLADEFLVTYGDSYLPFDYGDPLRILESHDDCDGVMAIFKNDGKWDVSNVKSDGTWVLRYEKGGGLSDPAFDHIDYGATALRATRHRRDRCRERASRRPRRPPARPRDAEALAGLRGPCKVLRDRLAGGAGRARWSPETRHLRTRVSP